MEAGSMHGAKGDWIAGNATESFSTPSGVTRVPQIQLAELFQSQ